jgi:hypothetical protein
MSLINRVALSIVAVFGVAFLVGCGSSGAPAPTPPPSGGFSKSDLKGTYVFSTAGSDPNGFFFTMAGTLQADGNGGIAGGTIDINDSDSGLPTPVQAFGQSINSNSSYTVSVDGRGQIFLTNTPLGTISFDFVLSSSSGGLITEFDGNGTGSGTLDLQTATITQAQMAQGYVFNLSGADSNANFLSGAGAFTLAADGTVASGTGVDDFNESQIVLAGGALNGNVTLGAGGGSGTAQLSTAVGTLSFNFYVIDANHLKFIETDALPQAVLSGDAFKQAAIPTGTLVFTMSGEVNSGGIPLPLAAGGLMTSTAAGQTTNGLEDANLNGTISSVQVPFTLNYSATVNGRSTLALTGFAGGPTSLAIYPFSDGSTNGMLMLEIDSNALMAGTAFLQSSTSLAAPPQGYGLNLTGVNIGTSPFELDDIAEFATATSGSTTTLKGLLDENDQGTPQNPQAIVSANSALSLDSPATGRGAASFASSSTVGLFNIVFYTVDGTNTLFLEEDNTQISVGLFQMQSSGSAKASSSAIRSLATRPMVLSHGGLSHPGRAAIRRK